MTNVSSIVCTVCNATTTLPVLHTPPLPVDTNRLWQSRDDARSAVKAPIDLTCCTRCGHFFNATYRDDLVHYEESYENSQLFSPRFQRYAEDLADHLITTYDLHGKQIVEIGGGKGDFLRIICNRGKNHGVSFGPSYRPEPGDEIPSYLSFVSDYYTERYAHYPADLILCRHVLEHLSNARELIATLRRAIGNRQIAIYFEVPNAEDMFRTGMIWDIIYTHCSYFTQNSLTRLFTNGGFTIRAVHEAFEGQFLAIEAMGRDATSRHETNSDNDFTSHEVQRQAHDFEKRFANTVARWEAYLEQRRGERQRIMLWGGGAKAVTFLNLLGGSSGCVSHIVDINPRKIGRFIAGTGHEIIAPQRLSELRPDVIIAMNPVYLSEIRETVKGMGLGLTLTTVSDPVGILA